MEWLKLWGDSTGRGGGAGRRGWVVVKARATLGIPASV